MADPDSMSKTAQRMVLLLCALVPGLFLGAQLAGLLFFLNPHWPFTPRPALRALLRYGSQLGGIGALILLPWWWGRTRRMARSFPWAMVVVFLAAALMDWAHAWYFALYLPPGINRRLLKAALWLSLGFVVWFYTALLHTLRQRPYSLRTRVALTLLTLLTVYTVIERRDAYRPVAARVPRPAIVDRDSYSTLVVVGIDSATLDVVLPMAERGGLPFLNQFLRDGLYTRVETLRPPRRTSTWMTAATGTLPYRHGAVSVGRYEAPFAGPLEVFQLLPQGVGFERWGVPGGELAGGPGAAQGEPPLWAVLARYGFEVAVVGWPGAPSFNATSGSLVVADEAFAPGNQSSTASATDPLALQLLAAARPANLDSAGVDTWRTGVAKGWLEAGPLSGRPRALFLFLPSLAESSRRNFGAYSRARLEGQRGNDIASAADLLEESYRRVDGLLKSLLEPAGLGATVAVISARGVEEVRGLETLLPWARRERRWAGETEEGSPDGMLLLRGPAVRRGGFLPQIQLVDIAPTLLYAVGLPVARDLDGLTVTAVFLPETLRQRPITFVPSYGTARQALQPAPR